MNLPRVSANRRKSTADPRLIRPDTTPFLGYTADQAGESWRYKDLQGYRRNKWKTDKAPCLRQQPSAIPQ